MITFDFSARVAAVTGAGGGMGLEIAQGILFAGGGVVALEVKPCPAALAQAGAEVPLGRVGEASELVSSVFFLFSDGASHITGIDLIVDGGVLLR